MTLNERVEDWAKYVGMISDGIPEKQMQKIAEEVTEATYELGCFEMHLNLEGVSSGRKLKKELGDILFATKVACYMMGFTPDDCLEVACDKNDKRRDSGKMINGNFVKKDDLK